MNQCSAAPSFISTVLPFMQALKVKELSIHLKSLPKHLLDASYFFVIAWIVSRAFVYDALLKHAMWTFKFFKYSCYSCCFFLSSFLASWRNWEVEFVRKCYSISIHRISISCLNYFGKRNNYFHSPFHLSSEVASF